jgi:hypothetical protein
MTTFGELALRSSPSMEDDMSDTFATIDLNNASLKLDGFDNSNASNDDDEASASRQKSASTDHAYSSLGSTVNVDSNNNTYQVASGNYKKASSYMPNRQSTEALNGSYKSVSSSNSNLGMSNHNQANGEYSTTISSNGVNLTSVLSGNVSPQSVLTSAGEASTKLASKTASTIESLRLWGKSAYKCTRQLVSEKLGKTTRTVDPEIEASIDVG